MRTREGAEAKGAQRDGEQAIAEILTVPRVNLQPANCKQTIGGLYLCMKSLAELILSAV